MQLDRVSDAIIARLAPDLREGAESMGAMQLDDVPAARAFLASMVAGRAGADTSVLTVERIEVPRPDGRGTIGVVAVIPEAADGALAAVVYAHGGGFVLGSASDLGIPAQLAQTAGVAVFSVDYRLAPEHPFPAAVDDVHAVLTWLEAHAKDRGIDPGRIGVHGVSAGATIAAGAALRLRDEAHELIRFQLLEMPQFDARLDSPSMREFTETPRWNRRAARESWAHYLGAQGADAAASPYASPAAAESLHGLPPTAVLIAELDPLRDEGLDFGLRLTREGVPTLLHLLSGTFHGSEQSRPQAASSVTHRRLRTEAVQWALTMLRT